MRRLLYGEDQRLVAWAKARIEMADFPADAKTIGIERNGEIAGAFIFTHFSQSGCFMNVASDGTWRWLNRALLVHAFAFPFIQCGLRRVSAVVSEFNEPSLAFVRRLGAIEEGRMRRAAPGGEDFVLFGMLRDECRFLPRGPFRAEQQLQSIADPGEPV